MSSESVCQVACSWVDVGSFHARLFGVMYVTCGDFYDGSEKGTVSVHQSFRQNTEWLSSPTHCTPLIWYPVTYSYFQK
jgi:hypothetical protein